MTKLCLATHLPIILLSLAGESLPFFTTDKHKPGNTDFSHFLLCLPRRLLKAVSEREREKFSICIKLFSSPQHRLMPRKSLLRNDVSGCASLQNAFTVGKEG